MDDRHGVDVGLWRAMLAAALVGGVVMFVCGFALRHGLVLLGWL